MPSSRDLSTLTCADFEPHVGDNFLLESPAGAVALRLDTVRQLGPALRPGGAFSLEFVSPPGPVLPQAIYALDHSALGRLAIFLVPTGGNQDGVTYEAIFT